MENRFSMMNDPVTSAASSGPVIVITGISAFRRT